MYINSISIGFIILPLAFEHITINVPELAFSTSFVMFPISLIASSIWPYLDSVTVLHITKPLTLVNSTVLEYDLATLLQLLGVVNAVFEVLIP